MSNNEYMRNWTADQAQAYLVAHNVPVKSRPAFYRYIENQKIPYTDLTPWSKKSTRRFSKEELDIFLESVGVTPNDQKRKELDAKMQMIEAKHGRGEAQNRAQSAE